MSGKLLSYFQVELALIFLNQFDLLCCSLMINYEFQIDFNGTLLVSRYKDFLMRMQKYRKQLEDKLRLREADIARLSLLSGNRFFFIPREQTEVEIIYFFLRYLRKKSHSKYNTASLCIMTWLITAYFQNTLDSYENVKKMMKSGPLGAKSTRLATLIAYQ